MQRSSQPTATGATILTPPIQVLDAIEFEERFKRNEIDLVSFNFNETPENIAAAVKKVPLKEKLSIIATNTISSLGLALGSTIGILLKFTLPTAIGGAGLVIETAVMGWLSGGAGLLAFGLAFFVHKFYTKESIKNTGILISQIKGLDKKIDRRAAQILARFQQSFAMLLQMKLTLEQLKRNRERSNPHSVASSTENELQARIDNYIDFLVKDPNHPNFNKIKDDEIHEEEEKREPQIRKALERQYHIRNRLREACNTIFLFQDDTMGSKDFARLAKDYVSTHQKGIRNYCFPPLRFIATKTKLPSILSKPTVGLSFLGTFSGTIGLSYTSISLMTAFTVLPIAFPPLYLILGLAFVIAGFTAYNVYQTKKIEAQRNIDKKNRQKHLSYYYDANKLLKDRYTEELTQYNSYQTELIYPQQSPTPQPSPEFKKHADLTQTRQSICQNRPVDYASSSTNDLRVSPSEDIRFNDLWQLKPRDVKSSEPDAIPLEEVKRDGQNIPSITTPGLSVFSHRNSDFSTSNPNLPCMITTTDEDLRFNDKTQLGATTKKAVGG